MRGTRSGIVSKIFAAAERYNVQFSEPENPLDFTGIIYYHLIDTDRFVLDNEGKNTPSYNIAKLREFIAKIKDALNRKYPGENIGNEIVLRGGSKQTIVYQIRDIIDNYGIIVSK